MRSYFSDPHIQISEQNPLIIILPNKQTMVIEDGYTDVLIKNGIEKLSISIEAIKRNGILFIPNGGFKKYIRFKEKRRRQQLKEGGSKQK